MSVGVVGLECVVPRVKRPLSNPCIHLLRSVSSTSSGWDCPESPPLSAEEGMTSFVPLTEDLLKESSDNETLIVLTGCSLRRKKRIITSIQHFGKMWKLLSEVQLCNVTGVPTRLCEAALPSWRRDNCHRGPPCKPIRRAGNQHRWWKWDSSHQYRDSGSLPRRGHRAGRETAGWGSDTPGERFTSGLVIQCFHWIFIFENFEYLTSS